MNDTLQMALDLLKTPEGRVLQAAARRIIAIGRANPAKALEEIDMFEREWNDATTAAIFQRIIGLVAAGESQS